MNPPLPPACLVSFFRFNKYLKNQHLKWIDKSSLFSLITRFTPLSAMFFELNRDKSKVRTAVILWIGDALVGGKRRN